jgi:hypothetical protein
MRNLEQWFDDQRYELTESLTDEQLLADAMQRSMSHLSQREQLILRMRYGLGETPPLTLEEVATKFRLTRERVRQLEATGLETLSRPPHRPSTDLAIRILRPTLRVSTQFTFASLNSIVQLTQSRLPAVGRLLLDTYDIADRLRICTSLGTIPRTLCVRLWGQCRKCTHCRVGRCLYAGRRHQATSSLSNYPTPLPSIAFT